MADVAATLKLGFDGLGTKLDRMNDRLIAADIEREKVLGVKWMRLPLLQGTVTATGISLGENTGAGQGYQQKVGPDEGYGWRITRLCIAGLTYGTTPDVVNIFRTSANQQGGFLWQLNGNSPGSTFGKGQITLGPGDTLTVVNQGTVTASVGTLITLSGELISVPAEMLGKIID
jgi:hypothetical protein